ncbi:MAG: hypothetical protein PHZ19_09370 [Candidatus Thermoplasmatota archaeon]|nr:hypothetical protein [Candidatus Thermoplasmatota archaeon]
MSQYPPVYPPESLFIKIDDQEIKRSLGENDPEALVRALKNIVQQIQGSYGDLVNSFIANPEFNEGNSQPAPANGRFLVWKDTNSGDMRLLYGDQDLSFEFGVRYASAAETQAQVIDNKAVTPAGLGACVASNEEVQGQTETKKFVTPAGLGACTATEDRKGLVERATNAEVQAGTDTERYITPKTLRDYGAVPYVKVSDRKASGTYGGTFTSGAWRTRDLNTKDTDTHNIASLSNNQITLPAGTYHCLIRCPTYKVQWHRARLYNVTGSAVLVVGGNAFSYPGYNCAEPAIIQGRFTLSEESALEVHHRCSSSYTTSGFGVACEFGDDEVYTVAEFWKVG